MGPVAEGGTGCDRGAGVPSIWPKDAGAKAVPKPPEPGPAGGEGAPPVPRSRVPFSSGPRRASFHVQGAQSRGRKPFPDEAPGRGWGELP